MKGWGSSLRNIVAVARREFMTRATTRSFVISTIVLVIASALIGLVPVVIGYVDRNATESVGVHVGADALHGDPVATFDALLNAQMSTGNGKPADASQGKKAFTVSRVEDLAGGRRQVQDGKLGALVDIERDAGGDATFTIYVNDPAMTRTPDLIRQAAASIAIADRLGRAGLTGAQQAQLFSPPSVTVRSPDLSKPAAGAQAVANDISTFAVTFGLVMFLFLAVILYGTWVAMSVVEEKSNRVMEIILAAATPFQLLSGKVLGVGATALLQYVAVLAAALVALLVQGQVATVVLGESNDLTLPQGLTPGLLFVFSIYFVLGFLLYAVLFAAAGSLVSRQEDVNQVVTPMTLVSTAGYLVGLYASIGIVDPKAPLVIVLSWIPFLSPYMMLGRVNGGNALPIEVVATMVLLAVTIVGATWVAARIYSAGVLMYGQRPSLRHMWVAIRTAR
jgi:ABC-2 type transport system permease protein